LTKSLTSATVAFSVSSSSETTRPSSSRSSVPPSSLTRSTAGVASFFSTVVVSFVSVAGVDSFAPISTASPTVGAATSCEQARTSAPNVASEPTKSAALNAARRFVVFLFSFFASPSASSSAKSVDATRRRPSSLHCATYYTASRDSTSSKKTKSRRFSSKNKKKRRNEVSPRFGVPIQRF
jgi:hypothetical protein